MAGFDNGLISIIVPVYNAGRFIQETIESVQAQSCERWELILVDDCSKDDSADKIEKLAENDSRIRLVRQERNLGAARCRNKGLSLAKGRYICFLDADDIWERDKLSRELAFMRDGEKSFVFTSYEFADENGRGTGKIAHVPSKMTHGDALKNTSIFTSTVMIDRKQVADEYIEMPIIESEDTATWWNILKKCGVGYGLDECLVRYRRSGKTLSSNKLTAIRRIWELYRKHEGLSVIRSLYCMVFWAARAIVRRM